jgi:hypothetical protein
MRGIFGRHALRVALLAALFMVVAAEAEIAEGEVAQEQPDTTKV